MRQGQGTRPDSAQDQHQHNESPETEEPQPFRSSSNRAVTHIDRRPPTPEMAIAGHLPINPKLPHKTNSRVVIGTAEGGYSDSERFKTTNNTRQTPIVYVPNMEPQREIVGDAIYESMKKEYRRNERYARQRANVEVTHTRLEYERLDKEIREMSRRENKIRNFIRYQTNATLNDLSLYKHFPMVKMAKKPNFRQSDNMWGGNQEKQTVNVISEGRDFATTYSLMNTSMEGLTMTGGGNGH